LFFRSWSFVNTAWAVKTCTVNGSVVVNYYGAVNISIVHNIYIYTANGSVVPKVVAVPTAAIVTVAHIPITIVYTTVKTYMRTPVAGMKAIKTAFKPPVSGCP
jgi:hypothetical protein